jgi:hypothetical protein
VRSWAQILEHYRRAAQLTDSTPERTYLLLRAARLSAALSISRR